MNSTSDAARSIFVTGLKNAHALEVQATQIIGRQLDRLENYPDVAEGLRLHLEERRSGTSSGSKKYSARSMKITPQLKTSQPDSWATWLRWATHQPATRYSRILLLTWRSKITK